ncbi:unnamed protein product [Calicophoron daubneyi]|uniref:Annexin n=1 Tax=Calicophoron daubneyi TaxID=300641 RepID=A0AAV2T0Q1_CALDB
MMALTKILIVFAVYTVYPFLECSSKSENKTPMATSAFGMQRMLFYKLDGTGHPYRGTIEPTPGFSATADAERLHRAIRGAGTDENVLIQILARRTNYERQEICASYESLYRNKLVKDIRDDTSGEFKAVLRELTFDLPYLLAKSLYHAMEGVGTNERVLIEILPILWNEELRAVDKAYKRVLEKKGHKNTDRTLLTDITKETSGPFKYALQCLVQAQRDDIPYSQLKDVPTKGIDSIINRDLAERDAKELFDVGVGRPGTNEKRMTRVILGRTPFQLYAVNEAYKRMFARDLTSDIKKEASGDYRKVLLTALRYAIDRPRMIAEWFHDAMSGIGTKDYTLMRLLITRAEIDLEDVKRAYENLYGKSLVQKIRSETSGDYMKVFLTLLNAT